MKRYVRHSLGLKAPRGWGWLTNPRRAAYNRVCARTTVSIDQLASRRRGSGIVIAVLLFGAIGACFRYSPRPPG